MIRKLYKQNLIEQFLNATQQTNRKRVYYLQIFIQDYTIFVFVSAKQKISNLIYSNFGTLKIYQSQFSQQAEKYIKMLKNKLQDYKSQYIILTENIFKEEINGKKMLFFLFKDKFTPALQFLKAESLSIRQIQIGKLFIDMVYGLYLMHSNNIYHGRISHKNIYLKLNLLTNQSCFSLNILDSFYFFNNHLTQDSTQTIFKSEGQIYNLPICELDDLQSLIYVITHIYSGFTLFAKQKFIDIQRDDLWIAKWKSCSFYLQMIEIIPKNFSFITDFYLHLKTLDRNHKPNYAYWLKRLQIEKYKINQKYFEYLKLNNNISSNKNSDQSIIYNNQLSMNNKQEIEQQLDQPSTIQILEKLKEKWRQQQYKFIDSLNSVLK